MWGCMRGSPAPYLSERNKSPALVHEVGISVSVSRVPEFFCVSGTQLLSIQLRPLKCERFRVCIYLLILLEL